MNAGSASLPAIGAGLRRHAAALSLGAAAIALANLPPAAAVPPPTTRPDVVVELAPNGPEQALRDTVRAYQPVPVSFSAQAGDRLWLRLVDREGVLTLGIEAPSGQIGMQGARPGPDGMWLRLDETGVQRLQVTMSAEAARAGRAASFELGLRLRR